MIIWTDGSVLDRLGRGGCGIVFTCSCCSSSFTKCESAGEHCSSFIAELTAIQLALSLVLTHFSSCNFSSVRICSDSLSSITHLSHGPTIFLSSLLHNIWSALSTLSSSGVSVLFQWVPSHCSLSGNDQADLLAKSGATLPSTSAPLFSSLSTSYISSSLTSPWRASVSSKLVSGQVPPVSPSELSLPRSARCELSRLRCNGHSRLLSTYLFRIGQRADDVCPECGLEPKDGAHLLIRCPALSSLRSYIFPSLPSLRDLWVQPYKVARLLGFVEPRGSSSHPSEGVG